MDFRYLVQFADARPAWLRKELVVDGTREAIRLMTQIRKLTVSGIEAVPASRLADMFLADDGTILFGEFRCDECGKTGCTVTGVSIPRGERDGGRMFVLCDPCRVSRSREVIVSQLNGRSEGPLADLAVRESRFQRMHRGIGILRNACPI